MHTFDAEVFAVGKWNGMSFSSADLDRIVDTFDALKNVHRVPLKFGHNDEQKVTDGQPALGWVERVYRKGQKLFATFSDVPDIVKKAIEKKLYRKVSIELDLDVKYKEKNYRHVLSAVALLGADLPAVNVLEDLTAYMGRGEPLAAGARGVFSAISGQPKQEESEMDEKAIQAAIDKAVSGAVAPLLEKNSKLEAQVAKFTRDEETRVEKEKIAKAKTNRKMVEETLEAAVKQNLIMPAQRGVFSRALRVDDDEAMQDITRKDVEELIGDKVKLDFSAQGKGSGTGGDEDEDGEGEGAGAKKIKRQHDDPGLEVDRRAGIELARSGNKITYSQARDIALAQDVELAREYLNANLHE